MLKLKQLQLVVHEANDVKTANISLKQFFLLVAFIPSLELLYPKLLTKIRSTVYILYSCEDTTRHFSFKHKSVWT